MYVIYEGSISQGKAHGFGRVVYGDSMNSYIGYLNHGVKHGLGIEVSRKGRII